MKICTICKAHKRLICYSKSAHSPDGHYPQCKQCVAVQNKVHYRHKREQIRVEHAIYHRANRTKIVARKASRRQEASQNNI